MIFHLAQINISRLVAPIDDPRIAEFVARLDEINELAESSPGFVWRLKDDSNSAVNIQPFDDPMIIVNMSVWENMEDFKKFVYRTDHVEVLKKRANWFKKMDKSALAMWWIKPGDFPGPQEGRRRLEYLWERGETPFAFTFRRLFSPEVH